MDQIRIDREGMKSGGPSGSLGAAAAADSQLAAPLQGSPVGRNQSGARTHAGDLNNSLKVPISRAAAGEGMVIELN